MLFEQIQLRPITFFPLEFSCASADRKLSKEHLLPNTADLCGDESFAEVFLGWNDGGLLCTVESPSCESVELFIDTRDMKSAGFATRFCHHFTFTYEGEKNESTKFRTEDAHELCPSQDLGLEMDHKGKKRLFQIAIPAHCLHGYEPKQFSRIGFTYRLKSRDGDLQHLSAVTEEFAIEQSPSLWSTMRLES